MELSRRQFVDAVAGTVASIGLAGCLSNDGDGGGGTDGDEAGTDNSSSGENDEENDDATERTLELLAEEEIDHEHACLHAEFDERTALEAGDEPDTGPTVDETHVIWEVTYLGDAGYVSFDADAHQFDGPFVFYLADGTATPERGTEVERADVGDACEPLDEYLQIEPDDGQITLELNED